MKFIVIDGLDGCGKHTQATKLVEYLEGNGKKVLFLSYPVYGTKGSVLVESYLNGELSETPEGVNEYASSLFYAMDRYYDLKVGTLSKLDDSYDYIIADRYTVSSAIFQATKMEKEKRKDFCDWLFHIEYDLLGLPRPDCVVYLTMSREASQRLMTGRYNGDEGKKDLHEKDVAYLERCAETGMWAAKEYGWRVLDCTKGKDIMSIDEVHRQLKELTNDYI